MNGIVLLGKKIEGERESGRGDKERGKGKKMLSDDMREKERERESQK